MSTFLSILQKFTYNVLFTTGIFVWFTDNGNSKLLYFCRKLRFHPAYSTSYPFEHTILSTIINAINNVDSSKFLLQQIKFNFNKEIIHIKHNTQYQ